MKPTIHKKPRGFSNAPGKPAQRGLSLVIVLMFLLAITGITVWTARQSMLGEGMSRNQLDLEAAHQAAEAALRDAERDLMNLTPTRRPNASCTRGLDRPPIPADFTDTCTRGLCIFPDARYATSNWSVADSAHPTLAEPWWPTSKAGLWNDTGAKPAPPVVADATLCGFTGGVPLGTFTGIAPIQGVAVQPEYLIEYFKKASNITYQVANGYRITARGFGYTRRTQVVLQTIYIPV